MASVATSKQQNLPAPFDPVQMPISAFGVLERKNQDVRLAVVERAKHIAVSVHEPEVTPEIMSRALEEVARSGELAFDECRQNVSVHSEARRRLKQRLDRLQSLVMQQAGVIGLTAEAVELAWRIVWENRNLRYAALA